ncbi:MAG: SAM-dependent methyltransferase [Candidatus Latescibacterota bacterium]
MTRKSFCGLLLVLIFGCLNQATGQYDVPYEPSEYEIVEKMLKLGKVTRNDIVYDLGCGDGRIVITAVKEFGARGVGIDIDPVRIAESRENAKKAGVTDRIRFIEQNLFSADIGEATALMLFLWPEVNLKLRPKLFRDLKPGVRIVSHEHSMGDWQPDGTAKVDTKDWNHVIYLWVLPANVSGTWEWAVSGQDGEKRYVLRLEQKFQMVSGVLSAGGVDIPVRDISLEGKRLRFTIEETIGKKKETVMFDGVADENRIEGDLISRSRKNAGKSAWKATRNPATIIPLHE